MKSDTKRLDYTPTSATDTGDLAQDEANLERERLHSTLYDLRQALMKAYSDNNRGRAILLEDQIKETEKELQDL